MKQTHNWHSSIVQACLKNVSARCKSLPEESERKNKMGYIENRDIAGILYKLADIVRAYDDIMSLHDCNDCGKKDCQYKPMPGQTVRINCPLWEIGETE